MTRADAALVAAMGVAAVVTVAAGAAMTARNVTLAPSAGMLTETMITEKNTKRRNPLDPRGSRRTQRSHGRPHGAWHAWTLIHLHAN